MGWFERQAQGRSPADVSREHARYLRAARVVDCLDAISGPYGCRRFVVRFHHRGGKLRLQGVEGVPLAWGGGPPPPELLARHTGRLETALQRLHTNMALGPAWSRGVVAYLRDAQGVTQIIPAFDSDADAVDAVDLPVPGPPGHPLEDPDTVERFAMRRRDMQRIHAATRTKVADWDWWSVEEDVELHLHYDESGQPTRVHRCHVLATHETRWSRFTWRTAVPVGSAPVYGAAPFASTLDASMELGLLACAVLGADWLFVQPYDDHDSQLLVAVFR